MSPDIIIGIDAGTSVIKSVAFSTDGRQLAAFALPNSFVTVPGGGAEQDMARTWTDTAATLRGLAGQVPDLAARVAAIGVTGQGDGTWLMDEAGEPTAPALLWLDARAGAIVDSFAGKTGARARFETTGVGLAACQQGPQLLWIRANRPDWLRGAATAFHCKDWLYFKLTGERATDPSEGGFSYGDFRTRRYSPEVVSFLGLGPQWPLVPPMVEGTTHAARLSAAAAAETGLPAGTPLVLGYVDVICTALGAGLYEPGAETGCAIIGSTGMQMRFAESVEHVTLNADGTGYTMPFPVPGTYAQMQSNMAATLNIDWLLDVARGVLASAGLERSRRDLIAGLDDTVMAAEPGQVLFHPFISEAGERGPFIDVDARASLIGLNLRHGFPELMRAVYEGLAMASRDCYAAMGGAPAEVRVTGGAARSRALRAIIGAALGSRVRSSTREEAGAAGVAMMAAVCLGLYADMAACVRSWVSPLLGATEDPDPKLAAVYDRLYPSYRASREALAPTWHALAALRESRA
jgi:erythritol kinase (D-erythritol 1-phosphate-forming)